MRTARIKVAGEGFYHVVSRIGGRRFLIDDHEKGILLGMIRRAAAFSGVEVYTHAMMDNHFHLLIRVPERREVGEEELHRRIAALYGREGAEGVFARWKAWERKGKASQAEEEKSRYRARMHDLSQFCKTFKEAYTQDYNRRHGNTGTIWEGRFKSILLEGSEGALMAVAAYIHLNPIRARMTQAPEAAGNTGFGAGCGGDAVARAGLGALVAQLFGVPSEDWASAREACENAMEGKIAGAEEEAETTTLQAETPGERTPCEARRVDATSCVPPGGGGVGVGELVRRRHVGFLHGGALGSTAFLREMAARGVLPMRRRRRSRGVWDDCGALGVSAAMGVREAS